MVTELITHNAVRLRLAKANQSISQSKPVCAGCGQPIYRNSRVVRGNEHARLAAFHRRCFLAAMRACCALA